jgi:integrase
MGVKVREKPPGSGNYWIFINHQGRRKSKKSAQTQSRPMRLLKKSKPGWYSEN